MTEPTARPTRADFGYVRPVSTRWTDNDIYGHVNNAIYYQYFDSVINRYLIEEGSLDIHRGDVVGFIVRSECDYFAPVTYPGDVDIGVAVAKLGNSSVTYAVGLFKPGEDAPCALASMVHVFVETATNRPVPIPAPLRAALVRLVRPAQGG
ncbi:acyl-CoA thioesterase [Sphaerotilus microaerophilus]|uniref:Thioesterase n=1 Tax=Sphaerotilus microaerophilus TaxID=2914710 RepID=A0ABN6PE51_9BURK|nr:thioesterase family protein [Sphaerotilus sp. FB-5]BDI03269.1 thioesterase [Sphaerotilus sp. FB-5]